jgi:hypothetical protein
MFINETHRKYFTDRDNLVKKPVSGVFNLEDYPSSPHPYVKFPIEFPHEMMYQEYLSVRDMLVEHTNRQYHLNEGEICYANGWYGLTIHGLAPDKLEGDQAYGETFTNHKWFFEDLLPGTINFIRKLPYMNIRRVRYMIMKPRSYILPHTDYPHMWLSPLNFSITNPEGCRFAFTGYEDVPFKPGAGFLMNIGNQHMVYNDSDQERVHMIVHGTLIPEYVKVISDSL